MLTQQSLGIEEAQRAIAAVLEEHFTDLVERHPELLAHHLTGAGDSERAVAQWLTAGRYAAARSAHPEAIAHFASSLTVLASLLTLGRLSDYVGRRPVLLTALAVQVAAMVVFATADGVGGLLIARVIQGLSTGAALGAIGAAMLDIDTERGALANAMSPGLGSGSGAMLSALLVQYLPAPTHLVYLALIGVRSSSTVQ